MSSFIKRFHGRNHVPGQLITAAELIEMQQLQYKTYCNIEADRYGLNPDGSFTPHVISGFTPSVVAGAHQIKIGRGHGFATASLFDAERVALVLENDLLVDLPAPNATHPFWVHVHLEAVPYTTPETYGAVPVAIKSVDDVIRNISTPLYYKATTTVASTANTGAPAASPLCPVMSAPHQLPIATVLINPGDTLAIPAGQLYDVRWFAPGHGTYTGRWTETAKEHSGKSWITAQLSTDLSRSIAGVYGVAFRIPNKSVFTLVSEMSTTVAIAHKVMLGIDKFETETAFVSGALLSPYNIHTAAIVAYNGVTATDLGANESFEICVNFTPSI